MTSTSSFRTALPTRPRRWPMWAAGAAMSAFLVGVTQMPVCGATLNPTIPPLRGALPPTKAVTAQRSTAGKANTANSIGFDVGTTVPTTIPAASTGTLKDDFSTASDWQLFLDDTSIVALSSFKQNPALLFSEVGTQTLLSFPKSRVPTDADMQFSVSLVRSTDEYSVGAFCRGRGRNRYEFMVGSTGAYAIFRYDDGKTTNILPGGKWVASSSIPKGFTTINVGISCRGDQLSLLVGGQKIATVRDATYTVGNIGSVVSNFTEAELRAVVDDVTLTT